MVREIRGRNRKMRLLLVDDDPFAAAVMGEFLKGRGFEVESVRSGEKALGILGAPQPFELVLSKLVMPGMSGVDLLRRIRSGPENADGDGGGRPGVILITSPQDAESAVEAVRSGAFDYLTKPVEFEGLPAILERAAAKTRLLDLLGRVPTPREGMRRDKGMSLEAVLRLVDWMEEKDTFSEGHCRRVSTYAGWFLDGMGMVGEVRERVCLAARLHDLGKLLIGGAWLNHPGPLPGKALEVVREHSARGQQTLREILGDEELDWVRSHHERWDGEGYPDRLGGHRIPFGARVIAIADAFDAMTSVRSFRALRSPGESFAEITACSGTQFDPSLVPHFISGVGRMIGEGGLPAPSGGPLP